MKKKTHLLLTTGLFGAAFGLLTSCTARVDSRSVPTDHPANPQGPEGTAAPVTPPKTDSPKPAESDEPAQTEHHHHGM